MFVHKILESNRITEFYLMQTADNRHCFTIIDIADARIMEDFGEKYRNIRKEDPCE